MNAQEYLDDIKEIKSIMKRSSKFMSLSGLSGVMAGIYSLIGAFLAYSIIYKTPFDRIFISDSEIIQLIAIAIVVVALTVSTGIYLTTKATIKRAETIWDLSAKRLLINFLIPLITGGIFCLILIANKSFGYLACSTLIFYGLACIHASSYTYSNIKYLGISCVILGLLSAYFIGYGLFFWALGFGVFHIIYGIYMQMKLK